MKCDLCPENTGGITFHASDGQFHTLCWDCYKSPGGLRLRRGTSLDEALQTASHESLTEPAAAEPDPPPAPLPAQRTVFTCQFEMDGAKRLCGESGYPYCAKHRKMKCHACGEQATRRCQMKGFMICGEPECDKHPHHTMIFSHSDWVTRPRLLGWPNAYGNIPAHEKIQLERMRRAAEKQAQPSTDDTQQEAT